MDFRNFHPINFTNIYFNFNGMSSVKSRAKARKGEEKGIVKY